MNRHPNETVLRIKDQKFMKANDFFKKMNAKNPEFMKRARKDMSLMNCIQKKFMQFAVDPTVL